MLAEDFRNGRFWNLKISELDTKNTEGFYEPSVQASLGMTVKMEVVIPRRLVLKTRRVLQVLVLKTRIVLQGLALKTGLFFSEFLESQKY